MWFSEAIWRSSEGAYYEALVWFIMLLLLFFPYAFVFYHLPQESRAITDEEIGKPS